MRITPIMHGHLTRNAAVFSGFLVICVVGCSKHDDAPLPSASSSASTAASAAGAPSSSAAPASSGGLQPGETLAGRFGREAKSRPGIHPNAEDIFAALGKSGVAVATPSQSLGDTYKAAYCVGGLTPENLISVMVCEYGNEADAVAGRDYSKSLFPKLDSRTVVAHKTNTLTIIDQKASAASKAMEKKAIDTFNAT